MTIEKKIETIFLELLQIALGNRKELSAPCSDEDWEKVYNVVKKQSMIGITFYAVKQLPEEQMPPRRRKNQWALKALQIEDRNKLVCNECVKVTNMFTDAGFKSCILKGQSNLFLYPAPLRLMRTAGDIDIWVFREEEKDKLLFPKRDIIKHIWEIMGQQTDVNLHHVDCDIFPKTPVEVHFVPSFAVNPFMNRTYKRWFYEHKDRVIATPANFNILNIDFNIIFQMMRIYRHLLLEGIGFRQLLDLYFSLIYRHSRAKASRSDKYSKEIIYSQICHLGMKRITQAVMWILQETLGMDEKYLLCSPSEKYGKEMLGEMMRGGNFGQYFKDKEKEDSTADSYAQDKDKQGNSDKKAKTKMTKFQEFLEAWSHGYRLIFSYPSEVLWIPYLYIKASVVRNYWRRQ